MRHLAAFMLWRVTSDGRRAISGGDTSRAFFYCRTTAPITVTESTPMVALDQDGRSTAGGYSPRRQVRVDRPGDLQTFVDIIVVNWSSKSRYARLWLTGI